jgi:SAM-dependent methyltransferase
LPKGTARRACTIDEELVVETNSHAEPACKAGDPKLEAIVRLLRRRFGHPKEILVVGCGDGTEAALISELLEAKVVGIDPADEFHPDAAGRVELIPADARELPFSEGSCDVVFSFHVLEHVPSPELAVAEMRRVVRPGGGFWIGTPNRSRLLGYLGSRDATRHEKIVWNLVDWRARLRGRFRNEFGAHAGFTRSELRAMLRASFRDVYDETAAYFALIYPRYRPTLSLLDRLGLSRFAYPAIYFSGRT